MSVVYCHDCDRLIDTDNEEHFNEEGECEAGE